MNTKIVYIDDVAINVIMAQKRMKRKDLCYMAEINLCNFSTMMKRGIVRPKTAGKIAAALGVDVSEIVKQPQEEA